MRYKTFVSSKTRILKPGKPFDLEGGGRIEDPRAAVRSWGSLSPQADNAVLVCHALTGSADVDEWWGGILGAGLALDPTTDFVVATNVLGGCYGSSGPGTAGPRPKARSRPWGGGGQAPGGTGAATPPFPSLTIRDQVRFQALALEALGVRRLRLVVGGSMGGMQALEWGVEEPIPVDQVVAVGTPVRHSPWAVGLADIQRRAIRTDPAWEGGRYAPNHPPLHGLGIARMIAMCTYRSPGSFEEKFRRDRHPAGYFQVESYLRYQGEKLGERFDANSYLVLTEAMDTHDLSRGRGPLPQVLSGIRPDVLVVGITSDVLYLPEEIQELADGIPGSELAWIDSPHGHDAFLIEQEELSRIIRSFRNRKAAGEVAGGAVDGSPRKAGESRGGRAERCA